MPGLPGTLNLPAAFSLKLGICLEPCSIVSDFLANLPIRSDMPLGFRETIE